MDKQFILAIDTTEPNTGIGLAAAGPASGSEEPLAQREGTPSGAKAPLGRSLARRVDGLTKIKTWVSERNQSQELLPRIDQLLKTNRVKPTELKWVAVNLGPGSFTGLRVGISTANAFGYGLQIPVIGKAHLTGNIRERIQELLKSTNPTQPPLNKGRSRGIEKFRQVLPVYGAPPKITQPRLSR